MNKLSILTLATMIAGLQTGCLNRTAEIDISPPEATQAEAFESSSSATNAVLPAQTNRQIPPEASSAQALANLPGVDLSKKVVVTNSGTKAATAMLAPDGLASTAAESKPASKSVPEALIPTSINVSSFLVSTLDGAPLEVRESADSQATVIATLPQDTSVLMRVGDPTGTWFEVSTADGQVGWVAGAFLVNPQTGGRVSTKLPSIDVAPTSIDDASSVTSTNPIASDDESTLTTSVVSDDGGTLTTFEVAQSQQAFDRVVRAIEGGSLPMRDSPHLEAEVLRDLPNGTPLRFLQDVGPWSYVVTEDGTEGFVAKDYLVVR